MRHLKQDRRGVSTVIAVMLSLVLIAMVVANVVIWSYEMNESDWERTQEKASLTEVQRITRSNWVGANQEFSIDIGTRISGTYIDTQAMNEGLETYIEQLESQSYSPNSSSTYRLAISGVFNLDLSTYPVQYINSIEILIRYRANDSDENWFVEAYNLDLKDYSDLGFNSTEANTPTAEFTNYAVSLTSAWRSYVSENGTIVVSLHDATPDANATLMDVDFFCVRAIVDGAKFSFRNEGSLTLHIVSLWVTNSTLHKRYDANLFINSGDLAEYARTDIKLPSADFVVKAITDRGNIIVLRSD